MCKEMSRQMKDIDKTVRKVFLWMENIKYELECGKYRIIKKFE